MKYSVSRFLLFAALLFAINGISVGQQLQVGQAVGPNSLDVTKYPGSDICAKLAAAATSGATLVTGGMTLDMRGFSSSTPYTCSTNPFANWPTVSGPAQVFLATILVDRFSIYIDTPWIFPSRTRMVGMPVAGYAWYDQITGGQDSGFILSPSTNFPSWSVTVASITNATPAVVTVNVASGTSANNIISNGQQVEFMGGTLGTPLVARQGSGGAQPNTPTFYYVINASSQCATPATSSWGCTFNLANWVGGTAIATSGASSGTITLRSASPVLQVGLSQGTHSTNTEFPIADSVFADDIERVYISCTVSDTGQTTHSNPIGVIGLHIANAQEHSIFEHIQVHNCMNQYGLILGGGAGDGMILNDIQIDTSVSGSSGLTANFGCLYSGTTNPTDLAVNTIRWRLAEIRDYHCYINYSTASPVTIMNLDNIYGDQFLRINGGYWEINGNSTNLTVTNASQIYGSDFGMQNMVVGGTNRTITNGVNILKNTGTLDFRMLLSQGTTNTLVDANGNGCTVPTGTGTGQDFQVAFFATRGDGSGTTERVSMFKNNTGFCPDLVNSANVLGNFTGTPTSSFNVVNGHVIHQ